MKSHTNAPRIVALVACASFALAVSACSSTDIGNPEKLSESEIEPAVHGYDGGSAGALTLSTNIELDAAWLVVGGLSFVTGADCATVTSVPLDSPVVVDLLAATATELPSVTLDADTPLCRVDLDLALATDAVVGPDAPAELVGNAVLLTGSRADGLAFELLDPVTDTWSLSAVGQVAFAEGTTEVIVGVALEVAVDVDVLDTLESLLGLLEVIISPDDNSDVLDGIRTSLEASTGLYPDTDASRTLDAAEIAAPLAL